MPSPSYATLDFREEVASWPLIQSRLQASRAGGPSYVNSADGARIFSNGPTIAVMSTTGNALTYLSNSDSFMLIRAGSGERIAGLGNGTIGLDAGKYEVAIGKDGAVKALGPSRQWVTLGALTDGKTQSALSNILDPQALNDLNQTAEHKGALGWLDFRSLGFDPSTVEILNYAQAKNHQAKVAAAQAAERAENKARTLADKRTYPPYIPIEPYQAAKFAQGFKTTVDGEPLRPATPPLKTPPRPQLPHFEAPGAEANKPYLQSVQDLSRQPTAFESPLPSNQDQSMNQQG